MRTPAQRNRRKTAYRVLNVVFILIGVAHLVALRQGDIQDDAFPWKVSIAILWLAVAGIWVAVSRIWGELAETDTAPK